MTVVGGCLPLYIYSEGFWYNFMVLKLGVSWTNVETGHGWVVHFDEFMFQMLLYWPMHKMTPVKTHLFCHPPFLSLLPLSICLLRLAFPSLSFCSSLLPYFLCTYTSTSAPVSLWRNRRSDLQPKRSWWVQEVGSCKAEGVMWGWWEWLIRSWQVTEFCGCHRCGELETKGFFCSVTWEKWWQWWYHSRS